MDLRNRTIKTRSYSVASTNPSGLENISGIDPAKNAVKTYSDKSQFEKEINNSNSHRPSEPNYMNCSNGNKNEPENIFLPKTPLARTPPPLK